MGKLETEFAKRFAATERALRIKIEAEIKTRFGLEDLPQASDERRAAVATALHEMPDENRGWGSLFRSPAKANAKPKSPAAAGPTTTTTAKQRAESARAREAAPARAAPAARRAEVAAAAERKVLVDDATSQLVARLWRVVFLISVVLMAYVCGMVYQQREWIVESYKGYQGGAGEGEEDKRFG